MSTMSVHHVHHINHVQSTIKNFSLISAPPPAFCFSVQKENLPFIFFPFCSERKLFTFQLPTFSVSPCFAPSREKVISLIFLLCFSFFLLFCIYSGICWGQRGMMVWKNTFSLQNTYFFLQKYTFFLALKRVVRVKD